MMLEKPDLADEIIVACLHRDFSVQATDLTFLPIGNDVRSWVYALTDEDGTRFFLKARKGPIYAASFTAPRYLKDRGIEQVVAPLPTLSGALWAETGDFALILYPHIEGVIAADVERSDSQHTEFGALLAEIHATTLPAPLLAQVNRESFMPKWGEIVRTLQSMIERGEFESDVERELAIEWQARTAEIRQIVERSQQLGRMLQTRSLAFVLCHADIHSHNQLIDDRGRLHIVDWDEIILAPKERDLMFVVGDIGKGSQKSKPEQLFFHGYGNVKVDALALAYYRYEWVVQEIGDCGARVLLTAGTGNVTRKAAIHDFVELFEPDDVVDGAYQADAATGF